MNNKVECPILSTLVEKAKCRTIECQWTTNNSCCYGLINPENPDLDIAKYKSVSIKEIKSAKNRIRWALIADKYIEYCSSKIETNSTDILSSEIEDLISESDFLDKVRYLNDKLLRVIVNKQIFDEYVKFYSINSPELSSVLFLKPESMEKIRLVLNKDI